MDLFARLMPFLLPLLSSLKGKIHWDVLYQTVQEAAQAGGTILDILQAIQDKMATIVDGHIEALTAKMALHFLIVELQRLNLLHLASLPTPSPLQLQLAIADPKQTTPEAMLQNFQFNSGTTKLVDPQTQPGWDDLGVDQGTLEP
jgi:hypothetical protein